MTDCLTCMTVCLPDCMLPACMTGMLAACLTCMNACLFLFFMARIFFILMQNVYLSLYSLKYFDFHSNNLIFPFFFIKNLFFISFLYIFLYLLFYFVFRINRPRGSLAHRISMISCMETDKDSYSYNYWKLPVFCLICSYLLVTSTISHCPLQQNLSFWLALHSLSGSKWAHHSITNFYSWRSTVFKMRNGFLENKKI
jgi:hypothetical protein